MGFSEVLFGLMGSLGRPALCRCADCEDDRRGGIFEIAGSLGICVYT